MLADENVAAVVASIDWGVTYDKIKRACLLIRAGARFFATNLDPTRPTLRTGTTGTRENYDVHPCGNITEPDEGNLQPAIRGWFEAAGNRTTTNTEYKIGRASCRERV